MKIYIASSWKNKHTVEMLTTLLRGRNHEVLSFVENEGLENVKRFEEWVNTPDADQCFEFDTNGATKSDLVIYISPSGKDAAAEVGAAWASGITILGLFAKGEDFGLMRKMISQWFDSYTYMLQIIDRFKEND